MGLPSKQFALDTNVLLDLAEKESIALRFHRTALEKGFPLAVTFTVLKELGFASLDTSEPLRMALAHLALEKMHGWGITPIPKTGLHCDYAEDFSQTLRDQGLFPAHERNDGLILAEASLNGMSILITSDSHFYKDPQRLALAFANCHLPRSVVSLRPAQATMYMAKSVK